MVYDFIQNYFYVPEIHILPLFALYLMNSHVAYSLPYFLNDPDS